MPPVLLPLPQFLPFLTWRAMFILPLFLPPTRKPQILLSPLEQLGHNLAFSAVGDFGLVLAEQLEWV